MNARPQWAACDSCSQTRVCRVFPVRAAGRVFPVRAADTNEETTGVVYFCRECLLAAAGEIETAVRGVKRA